MNRQQEYMFNQSTYDQPLSKAIIFPTHYSMLGWIKFTTYKNDYKPVHKNSCHGSEKYNLKDHIIDLWNSFFFFIYKVFFYIYI